LEFNNLIISADLVIGYFLVKGHALQTCCKHQQPLQSIMLSYLLIVYIASVSDHGLAWATSRTALCDFGDVVMCGGGYVTLVTDW
jgi:hypothetical protein